MSEYRVFGPNMLELGKYQESLPEDAMREAMEECCYGRFHKEGKDTFVVEDQSMEGEYTVIGEGFEEFYFEVVSLKSISI